MRRSFPGLLLGGLLGLCLTLVLHACQNTPIAQPSPSVQPVAATTTQPEPMAPAIAEPPLPPETLEIAATAGPKGLYNPSRGNVRLVVISDLNSAYGSTDYEPEVDKGIALVPFWKPDLVISGGDMVAGQKPSLTNEQLRAMWASFDRHVAAPLRKAKVPFGFTIGNHDASGALGARGQFLFQRERDMASEYWKNPAHNPGVQFVDRFQFPFYYTFQMKDVFFLVWDGSTNQIPKDKLAWVEKALSSPQAKAAKLRILVGHLPLYAVAVSRDEPGEVMANADQLRAMLEKYQVHTYISGHHHAYYPAHRGKMQFLHTGILGAGPRPLIEGSDRPWKAITVLDINPNAAQPVTYTTYNINTLQVVKNNQLPRFLRGHNGMLLRQDVETLTAEEKASCLSVLDAQRCSA